MTESVDINVARPLDTVDSQSTFSLGLSSASIFLGSILRVMMEPGWTVGY